MLCELYGVLHKFAKKVLGRSNFNLNQYRMVNFTDRDFDTNGCVTIRNNSKKSFINEYEYDVKQLTVLKSNVYPVENLVPVESYLELQDSFSDKKRKKKIRRYNSLAESSIAWESFINNSRIPYGYRNAGLHYAGYIREYENWCLPSWVWTNGALVRYYCTLGEIEKAKDMADIILDLQHDCGGWIVRNDYSSEGIVPVLAPNDSAYLANNCCLSYYLVTKDEAYLVAAERCAKWIMETARSDGFVYFGFDDKRKSWIKDRNIVDIGFTAALFAKLYEITEKKPYLRFLERFVEKYIELFYMEENRCFATSIDENNLQIGGAFGRGQAWALEGLIPTYQVTGDAHIKNVIQSTIQTLLDKQDKNGGWSYNLVKPLMGTDCKGTPVIARSIMEWYFINPDQHNLYKSAEKALNWCVNHTDSSGESKGGIFSYTIEGAVVHHMYTNTAFVYASSYALEVKHMLEEI